MVNLRIEKNSSEIVDTLIGMYSKKCFVTIWQNISGKRVLRKSVIKTIDLGKRILELKPLNKDENYTPFSNKMTFYIHGEYRSILFKQECVVFKRNKILISIPSEVRLFENRKFERIVFNNFLSNQMSIRGGTVSFGGNRMISVTVIDISKNGVGFQITREMQRFFYQGDWISIEKISDIGLEDIEAKICYIAPVEKVEDGRIRRSFRVGASFKHSLTKSELQKIRDGLARKPKSLPRY